MNKVIKRFNEVQSKDLFELYKAIYSTSDLMSESFEDKYKGIDDFEKELDSLSKTPSAIALTVLGDEKPIAYLTIKPRPQARLRHTADLNMGVGQNARGEGVGELILRAALEQAQNSDELEIIYLMVRADNQGALRLYRKVGFEKIAVLEQDTKVGKNYYDGVLMRKFVK